VTLTRTRPDLCPGVCRPWSADDGALVRLRLVGGRTTVGAVRRLHAVATSYGDGRLHLTGRANLQVRALPDPLTPEVVTALHGTGLVPSPTHELARNVLVSPLSGRLGGRADLRPVADELDHRLCASPALADLPGRFLLVLDDGRGDLADRSGDLGLVVLDGDTAQLRVGETWGPVVPLPDAAAALVERAERFLAVRGDGPDAPWHVRELGRPLEPGQAPDRRALVTADLLPPGPVAGLPRAVHHVVADGLVDAAALDDLLTGRPDDDELVVTPWRGVLTWS